MPRPVHGPEPSRLPALLALAACIGLAFLNWRLFNLDIDLSAIAPGGGGDGVALALTADLPTAALAPARAAFPETLARPLFRASRRPPDPAKREAGARASAPKPAAALPMDLKLVGIVKEKGSTERALVRSGEMAEGQWLEVGQSVAGWRLARIEETGIVFEANGEERKLSLFPKTGENAGH